MVCCVKLNRLLRFMAFAGVSVFISVSLSFFLTCLGSAFYAFVIIRTIKPFDRFAHIVALAWFMLLFVYKFFAVVCRLHRSIGNNQSELRKNSTATSGVRFLCRGSSLRSSLFRFLLAGESESQGKVARHLCPRALARLPLAERKRKRLLRRLSGV